MPDEERLHGGDADNLWTEDADHLHGEVEDLRHEVERFKEEKERVRAIIGRIGGAPTRGAPAGCRAGSRP